jgi:hypothetical protein
LVKIALTCFSTDDLLAGAKSWQKNEPPDRSVRIS